MAAAEDSQAQRMDESRPELIHQVISNLPVSVLIHQEGRIVYANQALLDYIGRTWEEIRGHSVFDYIAEESKTATAKNMARRAAGEIVGDYEISIETKNKGRGTAIVRAVRIFFENAAANLAVLMDISGRKQAEELLRLSENRYREMFEHINAGVAVYEAVDNGRDFILKDLNPAGERISRISNDHALGKRLLEIFPNMDKFGVLAALQRVYHTGRPEHLPAAYYEDGVRRGWRENFLYKLPSGEVVGIYEDITDRKQAEEERRASEERLKILFDFAPDAYYLNDLTGTFVDGNKAAENILGYRKNELLGKSFLSLKLLPRSSIARAAALLAKNALGLPTGPDEFTLRRKDGTSVIVEIRTHPVKIGGKTLVLGIARDIIERKAMEAREKALEAQLRRQEKVASIATLAGGVAHEINNPLAGIMNYAQLIKDESDAAGPTAKYAEEIIRETKRAATVVRSLLAFSRPNNESRSEAAPATIIDGVAGVVEADLRERGVRFVVDVPPGIPNVICNVPQVQQILLNLVINAWEALAERAADRKDGPRLRMAAENIVRDGSRFVRMTVENNGLGIPKDVQNRLFDPFFTTKSRALHVGLGLAISQRIAEEHGGRLWFEGKPGLWTRFHLDLPTILGDKPARKPET